MRQFKQITESVDKKKPIIESIMVTTRPIDAVARELTVDGTRVVLVNVDYVLSMEKRIKVLETQLLNIKGQLMYVSQKVKSIK